MSAEPDAERCEACAKMRISVAYNRWGQEVGGEDTSIDEHHALIARLRAERDAARAELEEARKVLREIAFHYERQDLKNHELRAALDRTITEARRVLGEGARP